jgi:hypothetical protein
MLCHSQPYFYAIRLNSEGDSSTMDCCLELVKRPVDEAETEHPVRLLSSTYIQDEHRIRDSAYFEGQKILTFSAILKYNLFPIGEVITDLLNVCRQGMGCPVEIEFAVDLNPDPAKPPVLYFLQLRPLTDGSGQTQIRIQEDEIRKAICFSTHTLGHGWNQTSADLIYVNPDTFASSATLEIGSEIAQLNSVLIRENRRYLLVGPGRWGSKDRWLGIPVRWKDISGVCAIVEARDGSLPAEASYGSHFLQQIIARGVHYITLEQNSPDHIRWDCLKTAQVINETQYLKHVRFHRPLMIKNDGITSRCVIYSISDK